MEDNPNDLHSFRFPLNVFVIVSRVEARVSGIHMWCVCLLFWPKRRAGKISIYRVFLPIARGNLKDDTYPQKTNNSALKSFKCSRAEGM